MKKTLYLLSGVSGSGKSTYARAILNRYEPETASWISRDAIRFSILGDNDDYFVYENKVIATFIENINLAIRNNSIQIIICDATHLTDKARDKTLSQLELNPNVEVVNVVFDVPLAVCLQRNALRTGRARVPDGVVKKMYYGFEMPNNGYQTIVINERGEIKDA